MAAITKKSQNGHCDSTVQDRDLQQRPDATKFGSVFNLNMMSAILDDSHYQKSQKWLP